jgi:hypothetical protein
MFDQAFKIAQAVGIQDLGGLPHLCRRDFDERETFMFRAQVPVLEYISLLIENKLLLTTNRTGRVYAGFEKLSRIEPVMERYLRIADVSERVYIFGEPDWKPPRHPHVRIIGLESTNRMARELFVIADSSTLRVALVAVDEDGFDAPFLEARKFRAIKSSNPAVVSELAAYAEGLIDTSLAA